MENAQRRNVLVVDDEPIFIEKVRDLLSPRELAVMGAKNAYEALERSKTTRPEAILIDVVLPDIEGPQLCRLLRQTPGFEMTPIIFMTAQERERTIQDCLEAGGNDFIRKAQLDLELPVRLDNHLRTKHEHDRLLARNQELSTFLYFARLLNRSLSLHSVLQSMVEELGQILNADRCSVILWREDAGRVLATAETVDSNIELELRRYPEIEEALETRQPVYIPDIRQDTTARQRQRAVDLDNLGIESILVVPLQTGGELLGTLFVRTARPNRIEPEAVSFCQAAAEIACRALLNAQLFEQIRAERDELRTLERGASAPAQPSEDDGIAMERVQDVQANITAEALGTINLISGYAELLTEPADRERLDARQFRALQHIQSKCQTLEQIVRLYQLVPARARSEPTAMSTLVNQLAQELAPRLSEREVRISVTCESDWEVPDRDDYRRFLFGLLHQHLQQLPGNTELSITIQQRALRITSPSDLFAPAPRAEAGESTVAIWHELASLYGISLMHRVAGQEGVETLLEFQEPEARPPGD